MIERVLASTGKRYGTERAVPIDAGCFGIPHFSVSRKAKKNAPMPCRDFIRKTNVPRLFLSTPEILRTTCTGAMSLAECSPRTKGELSYVLTEHDQEALRVARVRIQNCIRRDNCRGLPRLCPMPHLNPTSYLPSRNSNEIGLFSRSPDHPSIAALMKVVSPMRFAPRLAWTWPKI